jgi:hypothetical protein
VDQTWRDDHGRGQTGCGDLFDSAVDCCGR